VIASSSFHLGTSLAISRFPQTSSFFTTTHHPIPFFIMDSSSNSTAEGDSSDPSAMAKGSDGPQLMTPAEPMDGESNPTVSPELRTSPVQQEHEEAIGITGTSDISGQALVSSVSIMSEKPREHASAHCNGPIQSKTSDLDSKHGHLQTESRSESDVSI
jgi:hypothetical protein